jgi:hypothetical protein
VSAWGFALAARAWPIGLLPMLRAESAHPLRLLQPRAGCAPGRRRAENRAAPPPPPQTYANALGIRVVGDMPIYVGGQSADVWANRHLFELDEATCEPTEVGAAGAGLGG